MSSGDVSDIANQRRGGRPVRQLLEAKRKTSAPVEPYRFCRVGPGNFTPSLSQIRT